MSNWDLMMPGMGLTSIGLAGVVLAYADISHTFIDGMNALAGLTMFIGLIILAVGILDGGVSTSNRAKATVLVILSISLGFGAFAFTYNTISTTGIFAGILMAIAAPAVVIAYVSMKHTRYLKPVAMIFVLGSVAGIASFVGFGVVGPSPYLLSEAAEVGDEGAAAVEEGEMAGAAQGVQEERREEYRIIMLEGSGVPDTPDYDPDMARVTRGDVVVWENQDVMVHTATSDQGGGELFDTGLVGTGEEYRLDTADMEPGEYAYSCILHQWMTSVLVVEEPAEPVGVSIPDGSAVIEDGKAYYEPEVVEVGAGGTVVWTNDDLAAHTVTAGSAMDQLTGMFDSGFMVGGDTFEVAFPDEGSFDYLCTLHPWMTGTVTVSG